MALTPAQEQALDQLVTQMRRAQPKPTPAPQPDMLQTWLGISQSDLREQIFGLLGQRMNTKNASWIGSMPIPWKPT